MSARTTIISTIEQVAKEQSMKLAALSDDTMLDETGLDSLCWAIVFARLEAAFGFDPLADGDKLPITLGDVVKLYDNPMNAQAV
jgi:acyl carrier protein